MRRLAGAALALGVVAAMAGGPWPALAAWAAVLVLTASVFPEALTAGLRRGPVLVVLLSALAAGGAVALTSGPPAGLAAGLTLGARLGVLVLAGGVLSTTVSAEGILAAARRAHMERLGLTLGLALNTLPELGRTLADAWAAATVRGGGRRPRLRHLPALAETVLAHTARLADEAAAAAALRGHRVLVRRERPLSAPVPVAVLTGPTGSGKTTLLGAVVQELRARGHRVTGFLQPALMEGGRRSGFLVRDLSTGDTARLATHVPRAEGEAGTSFRFHRDGLSLAARALERATPGDILVADELGPIELRGGGHMPALRRSLRASRPAAAILVVRRSLVPSLLAQLDAVDAEVFDIEACGDPVAAVAAFCTRGDPAGRDAVQCQPSP